MKYKFYIILICLGLLLFMGCRSRREIVSDVRTDDAMTNENLITFFEGDRDRYHTMKVRRTEVAITQDGIMRQVNGSLAIYRDSLIAVSIIPALGFEAMRMMFTNDSVIVINRFEKSYSATSFDYYRRKYNVPITFSDLQAMLSNEVFYYKMDYPERYYTKEFENLNGQNIYRIEASDGSNKLTRQQFKIRYEAIEIANVSVLDYEERLWLEVDYEEFTEIDRFVIPRSLSMEFGDSSKSVQIALNYGQVVFNDSINVEFSIPANYKRQDY